MRRRSKHNLSHMKLLTSAMGYICPIQCQEVLPGDSFLQDTSIFMRTMPLVAPVMHPVYVSIHSWYVPTRLLWSEFEDFITGGPDGRSTPMPPTIEFSPQKYKIGELADYLSVPEIKTNTVRVSALPFRAYNFIYNEKYRDQDLLSEQPVSLGSGLDTVTNINLLRAAWTKDYFTLARPFEQKGPSISVPIGAGQVGGNVTGITATSTVVPKERGVMRVKPSKSVDTATFSLSANLGGTSTGAVFGIQASGDKTDITGLTVTNPQEFIGVNTTIQGGSFSLDGNIGKLDLRDFREAMAMQRFEEKRALYGSRYPDYLRFLGVRPSDARLNEPEYLGGGRRTIQFSEVLQTAPGDDPVGTLRGHGINALKTPRFLRFFEEHGYVMSFLIIRPKSIYMNGLPKMFSRDTKYDYWQLEYEHIGQEGIKNKELYIDHPQPDGVFGYGNRYNEYRTHPSTVHGEFRTFYKDWHLARDFSTPPALNGDFITCHPDNRIFAETTDNYDKFLCMVQNNVRARRLISKRGEPI